MLTKLNVIGVGAMIFGALTSCSSSVANKSSSPISLFESGPGTDAEANTRYVAKLLDDLGPNPTPAKMEVLNYAYSQLEGNLYAIFKPLNPQDSAMAQIEQIKRSVKGAYDMSCINGEKSGPCISWFNSLKQFKVDLSKPSP